MWVGIVIIKQYCILTQRSCVLCGVEMLLIWYIGSETGSQDQTTYDLRASPAILSK
jgi:hypothetical protein